MKTVSPMISHRLRRILVATVLAFGTLAPTCAAFGQAPAPVPAEPDTERRTRYSGVSSVTTFNVGFDIYADGTDYPNWLEVWVNGVQMAQAGNWNLVLGSGSLATLARPILAANANIVFNAAQSGTVDIVGARRPRRMSQFSESYGITNRDFNQILTDLWMTQRERWDRANRTVMVPPGETLSSLPPAATRANGALAFNSSGDLIVNAGVLSGANVSSVMVPFVQAASIAAAWGVLGPIPLGNLPAGIDTNFTSAAKVANYSAATSDCGNPIVAGGNASFTLTVGAASGFPANCVIIFTNVDAWGSGRGKKLAINGTTASPDILYPGMTVKFRNIGNVWFQEPGFQRVLVPVGTRMYVDVVNGLDSNDCLAAGAGNACQTLGHLFNQSYLYFHVRSGSSTPNSPGLNWRLATNPSCVPSTGVGCYAGVHFSGLIPGTEGHNAVMIECDGGSATNCTIADNTGAQAIGVYCACFVELRNVGLAGGSGSNNAIQVEKGMVRIEGTGVTLYGTAGNPQLSALDNGTLFCEGGAQINISGGGSYLAQTVRGGTFAADQCTFKWLANVTYSQATLQAATSSLISVTGAAWNLNGFTVTATNNIQCGQAGVVATGGAIASVPGTNAQSGCTSSGNGQVN